MTDVTTPILDHQTVFFFPFYFDATEAVIERMWNDNPSAPADTLLNNQDLLAHFQYKVGQRRSSKKPGLRNEHYLPPFEKALKVLAGNALWERETYGSLSHDLHGYLRKNYFGVDVKFGALLDLRPEPMDEPAKPLPFLTTFRLNSQCRNLVGNITPDDSADSNSSLYSISFSLEVNNAAARRTGLSRIDFCLKAAEIHMFQTGIAFLALTVKYVVPATMKELSEMIRLIQEGNYALCHRDLDQLPFAGLPGTATEVGPRPPPTRFADIARLLIGTILESDARDKLTYGQWSRIYTHTVINSANTPHKPAEFVDDLDRIARHYTSDYLLGNGTAASETLQSYQPFHNQLHSAGIEGGVILICNEDAVEHQRNWIPGSYLPLYFPIVILNLHSYLALFAMVQDRRVAFDPASEKGVVLLENLSRKVSEFRSNYQFNEASQISLHNQFHQLMTRAFQIDTMSERLTVVFADTRQFLSNAHAKYQEKRLRWVTMISSAIGGGFVAKEVATALKDKLVMNNFEWQFLLFKKSTPDALLVDTIHSAESWEMIVLCSFFVGAVLSAGIAAYFGTFGKSGKSE